jgi:RHS repeat-associated protein
VRSAAGALSNATGATIATATYAPYGTIEATTGTAVTPLGYAGQYVDAETGFQYLRARYYDPNTAQFLNRDPIESTTREPYRYSGSDPLNRTDPLGLSSNPFQTTASALAGTPAAPSPSDAAVAAARLVYENSDSISTVASGLATLAYIGCAASAGIGCGVGLSLSATSTFFGGISAYRACYGGASGCAGAAGSLALSAVATGVGAYVQYRAAESVSGMFNSYARDIYTARQAGVIGALSNGTSTAGSLLFGRYGTTEVASACAPEST